MSSFIKLTIGIPSIPERKNQFLEPLIAKLTYQIGSRDDIQILCLSDNKKMSIGKKREALFHCASGKYTCLIDDDDDVMDNFIEVLSNVITEDLDVDVISFGQEVLSRGKVWKIKSSLTHGVVPPFRNLEERNGLTIPCLRPPWHWCAWRTDLAKQIPFPDINWGEDSFFVTEAGTRAKTELLLDEVLCRYIEDPNISQAIYDPIKLNSLL